MTDILVPLTEEGKALAEKERAILAKFVAERIDLRDVPYKYGDPDPRKIAYLTKTQKNDDGSFSKVKLPYEGHAEITLDLIEIDPAWELDIASDSTGCWIVRHDEERNEATIFGTMSLLGVSRPCVGIAETHKGKGEKKFAVSELHKQLYSDLIRNGAMRFGVGTILWSKADRAAAEPDAPAASSTIPVDVANQFVSGLKTLDADLRDSAKQQLVALADTDKIAQIPNEMLAAVTGIVVSVLAEQAKRVPK